MPTRKWTLQATLMFVALSLVFALVQLAKGHELWESLRFGLYWFVVSTALFLITRIRNYRKQIYCKLCNDLPPPVEK